MSLKFELKTVRIRMTNSKQAYVVICLHAKVLNNDVSGELGLAS